MPKEERPVGGSDCQQRRAPFKDNLRNSRIPILTGRWNVGWPDSSTEHLDPVFRVSDAWKPGCFRACAHPQMMTETKLMRRHHLDRQQTTPSGLPAIRPFQGPAFGLELEEFLEAKLLCHHSLSKSLTRHRRLSTGQM